MAHSIISQSLKWGSVGLYGNKCCQRFNQPGIDLVPNNQMNFDLNPRNSWFLSHIFPTNFFSLVYILFIFKTREKFGKFMSSILLNCEHTLTDTGEDSKTSKSGREYFLLFFSDASERRVWLSAESKILASTFERFRLYRLKMSF